MRRRPAPHMAAGWANLDGEGFELDIVLPSQYHDRSAEWTPEQRLQAAVLLDAVRCYRKGSREATRWFASPFSHGPFYFRSICDSLNLSADAFRRRLQERSPRDKA